MSWCVWLVLAALSTIDLFFSPSGFALTPEEVLKLKAAGVSDETIQLMIQKEQEDKVPAEMRQQGYATDQMGTWKLKDGRTIHSTGKRQRPLHFPTEYPPPPPYLPQISPYVFFPPNSSPPPPISPERQQSPREPVPQTPPPLAPSPY